MDHTYDLTLLLDPEAEEDLREKILADIEHAIGLAGSVVTRHDWGLRQTAYEIRKRGDQDYRLIQFSGPTELLLSLDHSLKITDGISRFRIIKLKKGTPPAPESPALAIDGGDESDEPEGRGRGRDRDRDR